jgi:hypothetical protein
MGSVPLRLRLRSTTPIRDYKKLVLMNNKFYF